MPDYKVMIRLIAKESDNDRPTTDDDHDHASIRIVTMMMTMYLIYSCAPTSLCRRRRAGQFRSAAAARRRSKKIGGGGQKQLFLRFMKKFRSILKIFLGTFLVIKALRFAMTNASGQFVRPPKNDGSIDYGVSELQHENKY